YQARQRRLGRWRLVVLDVRAEALRPATAKAVPAAVSLPPPPPPLGGIGAGPELGEEGSGGLRNRGSLGVFRRGGPCSTPTPASRNTVHSTYAADRGGGYQVSVDTFLNSLRLSCCSRRGWVGVPGRVRRFSPVCWGIRSSPCRFGRSGER